RNRYVPNRERVDDLVPWWALVQTLSPVRRDLQTFCLFTGMRSEAARNPAGGRPRLRRRHGHAGQLARQADRESILGF
ncbi:MAG: hypothetical protein NT062_09035, partial [Proteobacteria bacterium]|nr:hypothetical protein [Pseudomonadota bacterium]